MPSKMQGWLLRGVCAAWSLLAVSNVTVASACSTFDKLSVQISWFSQPQFAGWEIPNQNNLAAAGGPEYADECLDVQVRPGGPKFDPGEELVQRKADVATLDAAGVALAVNQGQNFTIVANYFQRATINLLTLQPNQTLQDLNGSNIGIWPFPLGTDIPIRMMFKQAGLTANFVQQTFTLNQVEEGSIQGASVMRYNELAVALQEVNPATNFLRQQEDISVFDPTVLNVPFMHNSIVVLTERLPELRDRITRLLRVVNKAWLFCRDHEDECVRAYPRCGSGAHFAWQMRVINQVIFPSPGGLGVTQTAQWDAMVSFLIADGKVNASSRLDAANIIDNSMILAAQSNSSDDQARVAADFTNESVRFCAPYGSNFVETCNATSFEHLLCPLGTQPQNMGGSGHCLPCPAGRFSNDEGAQQVFGGAQKTCSPGCPARMLRCRVCGAGQFSSQEGQSACALCGRGKFRNASMGPAACEFCPPGKTASESGSTACEECDPGRYHVSLSIQSNFGVDCKNCEIGKYVEQSGASQCRNCLNDMATLTVGGDNASACVCPRKTYQPLQGSGCVECKDGMDCPVASSQVVLEQRLKQCKADAAACAAAQDEMQLLRGRWADTEKPLSVYLCADARSCPGGLPGRCADRRQGLVCGQCEEGWFHSGGGCQKCNTLEASGFLYPWLMFILGPPLVILLYLVSRDRVEMAKRKWTTVMSAVVFLGLLHYQSVGLLRGFALDMPSQMGDIIGPWVVLVDVASVLHPECMGYREFGRSVLLKVASPLHVVGTFIVVYFMSWVLERIGVCKVMNPNLLFNVCMSVVQTFFVPIAFIGLQIFMCYKHPNGESSLYVAPQVLCGSDEWHSVVGLGIAAVLVYVVGLLTVFSWVLLVAPFRYRDLRFRNRWKFLLLRQRVGMWWWSMVVLLKGLCLSLSQVIFTQGILQAFWTFLTLALYGAGLFSLLPWLHPFANFMDSFSTISLLGFVACISWFAPEEPGLRDKVSSIGQVISFLPLAVMCITLAVATYRWKLGAELQRQKRLEATQRLLKGSQELVKVEPQALEAVIVNLSTQDFTALCAARNILMAELCGQQPGVGLSGALDWRLLLEKVPVPMVKEDKAPVKVSV